LIGKLWDIVVVRGLVGRPVPAHADAREFILDVDEEKPAHAVVQLLLVLLHRQHVVGPGVNDLAARSGSGRRWRPPSPGRRDNSNIFRSFGIAVRLVALGVDRNLAQADAVGRRPRAHQMEGRLAARGVETPAERLAVDRHDLPRERFLQSGDPAGETRCELRRLERPKDRIEPIVRRNPRRQVEKLAQPSLLLPPERRDRHEVIRATNHPAGGDRHDADQRVNDLPPAGVSELGEVSR
jgi:hypothetical protein